MALSCTAILPQLTRSRALLVAILQASLILASGVYEELPSPPAAPPGFLGALRGQRGSIYALAASGAGLLASGAKDGSVYVWNITSAALRKSPRPIRKLLNHSHGVTALAFANEVLVSGSADNSTLVWDTTSGQVLQHIQHPRTVFGAAVSPDPAAGEFATACWDGVVRTFSLLSGAPKAELASHQGGLYAVAYSPLDASLLATASADGTVKIWDIRKQALLWTLHGHKDHVTSVDWSPRQPYVLASGSWDRRFRLWSLPAEEVRTCRAGSACSEALLPTHVARHPQLIWRVAFAPSGDRVAACHGAMGQSPTVVVYDAASGHVVRRLGRHKDTPLAIAYSPCGQYLMSAGMDRQVLLYAAEDPGDDVPQGDRDDEEEHMQWLQDMEEYRRERNSSSNASGLAALAHKLAGTRNASGNASEEQPWLPHPMSGMAAFL